MSRADRLLIAYAILLLGITTISFGHMELWQRIVGISTVIISWTVLRWEGKR